MIVENIKNLTKLSLSGCSSLTDDVVIIITTWCPRLEKLELAGNNKMEMANLNNLFKLKMLWKLNIKNSKVKFDNCVQLIKYFPLKILILEGKSFLNVVK